MTELQATYGVASEYPANTMLAFTAAAEQHYDSIYLDLCTNEQGQFLALNRDFSKYARPKFAGCTAAALDEVLTFTIETNLTVRIGHSFEEWDSEKKEALFDTIAPHVSHISLTCSHPNTAKELLLRFPDINLSYDGPVTLECLSLLSSIVPKDQLTIFVAFPEDADFLVDIAALIRPYAHLGVLDLTEYDQLALAKEAGARIVTTPGQLKHEQNKGLLSDMHTHSRHSMDANVPILDLAKAEIEAGAGIVAITEHCEMQWLDNWQEFDIDGCFLGADQEIREVQKELGDCIAIFKGIELGQAAWHPEEANRIIHLLPFDIIIGSVHEILDPDIEDHLAAITPWQKLFKPEYEGRLDHFLTNYFREMLTMVQTVDMDTLAHMTFITRTARNRHNWIIDLRPYESSIREILSILIEKGIALEINCGWSLKYGFFDPQKWIVELYRQMGGYLITLGSDAHDAPDPLMSGFRETAEQLKEMGFKNLFYFKDRRSYPCTI